MRLVAVVFACIAAMATAQGATCDNALERAITEGAIDPEEISLNQICEDSFLEGDKVVKKFHVCVISGSPPFRMQEKFGSRPLTVIYGDDQESEEHFKDLIGIWHSGQRPVQGKPGIRESVHVTVTNLGTQISRSRFKEMSKAQTIDKISLVLLEEALRHERLSKTGAKSGTKRLSEISYECRKNGKAPPKPQTSRRKAPVGNLEGAVVPEGKKKTVIDPGKYRNSQISE